MDVVQHIGKIVLHNGQIDITAKTVDEFIGLLVKHYPKDGSMRYAILENGLDGSEIFYMTREELFGLKREELTNEAG